MAERVAPEVRRAERQLPDLAAAIDVPLERLSGEPQVVAVGLALRGWSLYRGAIHALSGPSLIAAHVDVRALLDVMILARWIEDDPPLRVRLWFAEDQRERLIGLELFDKFRDRQGLPRPERPADWDPNAIDAEIQQARESAIAAGVKIPKSGRRCLPSIEEMVKAVPDLWDAYNVAYRHLSPVQHAGGRSFVRTSAESRGEYRHLKLGAPFNAATLRTLAIPAVCILFASVSRQVGASVDRQCDELRMAVVGSPDA